MAWVITSNGVAPGYLVAQEKQKDGTHRNFIAPVTKLFGGRLCPSATPLTFQTQKKAYEYLNGHYGLIPDTWKVVRYDPMERTLIVNNPRPMQ